MPKSKNRRKKPKKQKVRSSSLRPTLTIQDKPPNFMRGVYAAVDKGLIDLFSNQMHDVVINHQPDSCPRYNDKTLTCQCEPEVLFKNEGGEIYHVTPQGDLIKTDKPWPGL